MITALIPLFIILGLFGIFFIITLIRSIRIIPSKTVLVVERLGKYRKSLEAGIHILAPFIDKVAYKHSLKEKAINVDPQICITRDNVQVQVDGVLYVKIFDPKRASYGVKRFGDSTGFTDYEYASIQLAQTTMRSVIGKMDLDKTFEDRDSINSEIVKYVDQATDPWGITISRYEIQNIEVPESVLTTMEKQMQAERVKRARILESEGEKESRVNRSIGEMEKSINMSEGEKERRINEATGRASEILALSKATAGSISKIAEAINQQGGEEAVTLQLSENYIKELGRIAKKDSSIILPLDISDLSSVKSKVEEILRN